MTTATLTLTIQRCEERMHALQIPFSELTKWAGLDYGKTRRRMLSRRIDQLSLARIDDALTHFEAQMVQRLLENPHLAPEAAAKLRAMIEAKLAELAAEEAK